LNRDVVETINAFKERSFQNKNGDIALAEAAQGQDIFRYNAKSNGAEDYMALAKEIINKVNTVTRKHILLSKHKK
jgi:chromosome partitioning protein